MFQFLAFLVLLTPRIALAETPVAGPHGGKLAHNQEQTVEMTVSPDGGRLDFYLLHASAVAPRRVVVYLPSDPDHRNPIELRSVSAPGEMPHLHGEIDPRDSSSVGIELQIPLSNGKASRFRW